jgi:hypothetical protein
MAQSIGFEAPSVAERLEGFMSCAATSQTDDAIASTQKENT